MDRSLTWNVVVTPEFLLLMTTRYDVFEDFKEKWAGILEAAQSLGIPIAERLGLRYLDVIELSQNENTAKYLHASFSGPSLDWDPDLELTSHQVVCEMKSKVGKMVIRCYPVAGEASLPPDLKAPHIKQRQIKSKAVFLDFDHYSEDIEDFDTEVLIRKTSDLHYNTDLAFRNIITSHAKEAWGWQDLR